MAGIQIIDGTGSSRSAEVTSRHQLAVAARSVSAEHYANHEEGRAFSIPFSQSPTANNDAIFYLENTGTLDLLIEGVTLGVDQACEVFFQINDSGTRNGANALTPINLNSNSGTQCNCTVEQGADLDGGAATLTGGLEFERLLFNGGNDSSHYNFPADLVLKIGGTMTIWCSVAAATVAATVYVWETTNGD